MLCNRALPGSGPSIQGGGKPRVGAFGEWPAVLLNVGRKDPIPQLANGGAELGRSVRGSARLGKGPGLRMPLLGIASTSKSRGGSRRSGWDPAPLR